MNRYPSLSAERRASGFVIEGGPEGPLQASGDPGGTEWEIVSADRRWRLRRAPDGSGFELVDEERFPNGEERTCYLFRAGQDGGPAYLLGVDGRLFRILLRGPHDPRYELAGWEVPGAYLVARPRGEAAWRVEPSVACDGLDEIRELTVLFVAEILDQNESLTFGESA